MEKIIKEGKSVEAALSALMEENNLSKEEFLYTSSVKKGKLFQGTIYEVTAYLKTDINNEIKESAKKCFLEKNCEGEITLGDLASKGYVGVLVDPVTKEEVSKDECLKYENNEVVFCN